MTDQDPTAELSERMDATIRAVTDLWPEPLDEVHDVPQIRNALIADGFGDVAAERARVKQVESARDHYIAEGLRLEAQTIALQARIDVAPHGNGNGHVCPATFSPLQSRLSGYPPCNCWKSAAPEAHS